MKTRNWPLTAAGTTIVAILMTLLVLGESLPLPWLPWSPYFLIYGLLCIALPLYFREHHSHCYFHSNRIKEVFAKYWKMSLLFLFLAVLWNWGSLKFYEQTLILTGHDGDPHYSLTTAINFVAQKAALKFSISKDSALLIYALFILVWAPVAENIFYRGYLQKTLSKTLHDWPAIVIASFFFGIRHMAHFFFALPEFFLAPGIAWAINSFVAGLLLGWLYKKTGSLWPCIFVHFLTNLAGLFLP